MEKSQRKKVHVRRALTPTSIRRCIRPGTAETGRPTAGDRNGEFRIVAVAFVPQEGVPGIHFKPGKDHTGVDQGISDIQLAFGGKMQVLPTPDHHQFP